jgi:uncharacterized membrane protein
VFGSVILNLCCVCTVRPAWPAVPFCIIEFIIRIIKMTDYNNARRKPEIKVGTSLKVEIECTGIRVSVGDVIPVVTA